MLLILKRFLQFRLKQGYRMVLDIGGINLVLLVPLLFVFILSVLAFFFSQEGLLPVAVVVGLLLLVHLKRDDNDFLNLLRIPKPMLFFVEYFFYSIPILVTLGIFQHWEQLLYIMASIPIVAITPKITIQSKRFSWAMPNLGIPKILWEFRALWYQAPAYIILSIIIGVVASFWMIGYCLFILVFTFYLASAFQAIEGKEILESAHEDYRFLNKKVGLAMLIWGIITIPMHIIFIIQNIEYYFIPIIGIVWMALSISFSIYLKYAHYHPSRTHFYNSLPLTLFTVGLLIPFLLPIAVVVWFRMKNKAANTLQYYA